LRDVRMRGFAQRADVEEVERFLEDSSGPLESEPVGILDCVGRVLAELVKAECSVPGFARAAMDGYAVRGEETFGASSYAPIEFALLGETLPGRLFRGRVGAGEAVRVMTGAPLPEGADAVVKAEVCEERGARVGISEPVAPGRNVGTVGEDIQSGSSVLERGRRLRPQDAGVLASIGVAEPHCIRRPTVRLVVTGDELLPAGSRPEGVKIVDSNSVVLRGLLERDGAEVRPFEILPDVPARVREALSTGDADVILVSGGSSVGTEDHAPRLLEELGTLHFHGVSMRPSSPAGVGTIPRGGELPDALVFLLPGNPVSCLCAYEFFAGPTLRALGGRSREWPHRRVRLPLARKITSEVGRTDYVRVILEAGHVAPIATSGASILSSTVRASGCVIVPRELEGMPEGAEVGVFLYDADASYAEIPDLEAPV